MDLELQGKAVLITGASKGIGLACAKAFAAEGCTVHVAARSADLLAATSGEIQSQHGVNVITHVCDLRAEGAVQRLADACAHVDILVNKGSSQKTEFKVR